MYKIFYKYFLYNFGLPYNLLVNFEIMRKLYLLILLAVSAKQISIAQISPNITYNQTNVFTVGANISLKPSNTGGNVTGAEVTTFAGNGSTGSQNGIGSQASFNVPQGMAIDVQGNIYVVDVYNHLIRKITSSGDVSTFAGSGQLGSQNGQGIAATFNYPNDIAIDRSGNLFVSDTGNHKIRKITPSGVVSTFAGNGIRNFEDGTGTNASFNLPAGLVFDSSNNLYVVDSYNNRIRKITPSAVVSTYAGSGENGSSDGEGNIATFNLPQGIAIDLNDNLYIADVYNNKIRKITPSAEVSTLAGKLESGSKDGPAEDATFDSPTDVSFDNFGNLIVADINNHNIRKISPLGFVSTIAGNGQRGTKDGTATDASFTGPAAIIINRTGEIFITTRDNKIRKIINKNGTYTITPSLPEGLAFNSTTGEISGTANAIMAKTEFTVSSTNEYGSSSYTLTIQINDIAPNITYPTPNSFDRDKIIIPLFPANTGGKAIAYHINPMLPSGLNFNAATGEISGTPKNASPVKSYTITASNTGGSSSFEISIEIMEKEVQNKNIQISEAITPNGDGINDYWIIKNIEDYPDSIIHVFNRWGTEVFSARNYQNDWDGHYKNNAQPLPESSSYLYRIDLENDGIIDYQGWIYITK